MSILFHIGTGIIIAPKFKNWWLFGLIGGLPDIIGAVSFFGLDKSWNFYHSAHSLLGFLVVFLILLIFKQIRLSFPYLVHILIDIPTHYSGTSNIFWPFKDLIKFQGINWWQNSYIELLGWILIFFIFLTIFLFQKQKIIKNNKFIKI